MKWIWQLITRHNSLWVSWMQTNMFKSHNYWTCQPKGNESPFIKRLMQLRDFMDSQMSTQITDAATSVLRKPATASKEFSVKSAVKNSVSTPAAWSKVVWTSSPLPRHDVIACKALHNKLPSQERIMKWGVQVLQDATYASKMKSI